MANSPNHPITRLRESGFDKPAQNRNELLRNQPLSRTREQRHLDECK